MLSEAEKMKARRAVRFAVARGQLTRPETCEECGISPPDGSDGRSTLHAHHFRGYGHPLAVRWLCPKCHFTHDPRASGEANGRAQLTAEDVVNIRERYKPDAKWWAPEGGAKTLAREFGVSDRTIRRIVTGEIWIDAALSPPSKD